MTEISKMMKRRRNVIPGIAIEYAEISANARRKNVDGNRRLQK